MKLTTRLGTLGPSHLDQLLLRHHQPLISHRIGFELTHAMILLLLSIVSFLHDFGHWGFDKQSSGAAVMTGTLLLPILFSH